MKALKPTKLQYNMLSIIEFPTSKDVLFGRDADSWNHEGNRNFRFVVAKYQEQYHLTKLRTEKVTIVAKIVKELRESGARFLRRDCRSKKWFEVDRKAYIEKAGHAIRDRRVIRQRRLRKRKAAEKKALAQSMVEIDRGTPPLTNNDTGPLVQQNSLMQTGKKKSINQPDGKRIQASALSKGALSKEIVGVNSTITVEDSKITKEQADISVPIQNLFKDEDLLLSSIKKKQAVTRELITLHQQTALLAALRANEQTGNFTKNLFLSRTSVQSSLANILVQPQAINQLLSYMPVGSF